MNNKITPCLWFNHQAEEAALFYTSVFKNGMMGNIVRYPEAHMLPAGTVLTVNFQLAGQEFIALNGGPLFTFSPATNFYVGCENTEELDSLWDKLVKGGIVLMERDRYAFSERFGWVQDKYGLSWQLGVCGILQYITPFLMFVGNQHKKAEEAIQFYCSVFTPSGIQVMEAHESREDDHDESSQMVMHAQFSLLGQNFMAMDNGLEHPFTFNEAVSFYVLCETQAEIDHYWKILTIGGEEQPCGWLKDRYGVSWQIVPHQMEEWMANPDLEKVKRFWKALMAMKKPEVEVLRQAIS